MTTPLLTRSVAEGTPLIEGNQVTFVWQGAEAQLVGDFNDWGMERSGVTAMPLEEVEPEMWARTIQLPCDAYIEYGFVQNGYRRPDPFNPQQTADGMGHVNSFFWMPEAVDTPLARSVRGVPRGSVSRHFVGSAGFVVGRGRTVHLYQPAVDHLVPLLVVFDGSGYLRKAKIATIVDNLIGQKRIRPLAMALVDPGGRGRQVEYACNDATVAFIIRCVLPIAQQHLQLIEVEQSPGAYGIMGASMGGLMALYTAHRAPEIFGRVLCESGAFGADFLYYRSVLEDLIRFAPRPSLDIWMDVGLHEWYLTPNREMQALLRERGYGLRYVEQNSGHNYPSWRNILWRGLEHLFPTS